MKRVAETGDPRWVAFLRQHETSFNCELHLLATGQKQVRCLPENGVEAGCGWFLTMGDLEAGEWNLAHPFGPPERYHQELDLFPRGETFHLLVPTKDLDVLREFRKLTPAEALTWHLDPFDPGAPFPPPAVPIALAPPPSVQLRRMTTDPTLWILPGEEGFTPRLYLVEDDAIVSMVRTIHATRHTVEIYIETVAGRRDRGLGTWLLWEFIRELREAGRRLIYVTSGENLASQRVAQKVGLLPLQVLHRCPFRP